MGKDDHNGIILDGEEIIRSAVTTISLAHELVGGRFIKVDCSNVPELIDYYGRHGFQVLQRNHINNLNELIMFF